MIDHTRMTSFVDRYIRFVRETGHQAYVQEMEGYKFRSVEVFQTRFDITAKDLSEMLASSIENNNLTSGGYQYWPRKMLLTFASEYEQETRQALQTLFDQRASVKDRINHAYRQLEDIMRKRNERRGENNQSYFGLRFLSVLLGFRYPELYYPIKPREYRGFATYVDDGFKHSLSGLDYGRQYELYAQYADTLNRYIRTLPAIQALHSSLVTDVGFKDPAYIWMTQDVIYTGANIDLSARPESVSQVLGLLAAKRQIIFYGPPGTGKTYLAKSCSTEIIRDEVSL